MTILACEFLKNQIWKAALAIFASAKYFKKILEFLENSLAQKRYW